MAKGKISKPIQDRAIKTKARILKAARFFFSRSGFHGTRVDAIAQRAKVNKERIYAYFGSKEDLFATVLQGAFAEMIEAEESFLSLPDDEIPRLAEHLLEYYFSFHADHPYFWRLLSWENLEGGRHTDFLQGLKEPSFLHLRSLYEKGQRRGVFKSDVSFEAFIFVVTATSFFYFANSATMSRTLGMDLQADDVKQQMLKEILSLVSAMQGGQS